MTAEPKRPTPNEPVTVWIAYKPWGLHDKPVVKAFEGIRTAKQIRLDSYPQGGNRTIPEKDWPRLAYTELDAVRNYVADRELALQRAREQLEMREEEMHDAYALLAGTQAKEATESWKATAAAIVSDDPNAIKQRLAELGVETTEGTQ